MLVREFAEGQEIDQVLLVRGGPRPKLGDRTGSVRAGVAPGADCCLQPGSLVRVTGRSRAASSRCAPPAPPRRASTTSPTCWTARRARPPAWRPTCASCSRRSRTRTCARCWTPCSGPSSPTWKQFRDAPAAKRYHQAYRHGLLEHSLTVAQAVSAISATFPGIDRDVAVTGALLHDIGKLEAYTADPLAIDMTDLGKLQGEIPLGYYRIRRLIEDLPGFPDQLAAAVLHIILSHHGQLEHGSPVVPCTREATLVHMIDNLGGRLGSFDRLEKELPDGSALVAVRPGRSPAPPGSPSAARA